MGGPRKPFPFGAMAFSTTAHSYMPFAELGKILSQEVRGEERRRRAEDDERRGRAEDEVTRRGRVKRIEGGAQKQRRRKAWRS